VLANLDVFDSSYIFIVIKPALMRGFDYCAKTKGLDLLIAFPYIHERAATQALGRVGRNGDPCRRFKSINLESLIDDKQLEFAAKLAAECKRARASRKNLE